MVKRSIPTNFVLWSTGIAMNPFTARVSIFPVPPFPLYPLSSVFSPKKVKNVLTALLCCYGMFDFFFVGIESAPESGAQEGDRGGRSVAREGRAAGGCVCDWRLRYRAYDPLPLLHLPLHYLHACVVRTLSSCICVHGLDRDFHCVTLA